MRTARSTTTRTIVILMLIFLSGAFAFAQAPVQGARTQVRFTGPSGMKIRWYYQTPSGREGYSEPALEAPARYNFRQGGTYRLKLSDLPGQPGLTLYPTLEVWGATQRAQQFLAHSAVPLEVTPEDLRTAQAGNYIVKVVYLPGPPFQGEVGLDTLTSVQLEPGVDPIREAQRRGTVLVVLRLGNVDLEVPGRK